MGGQTALNCALSLRKMGVLERYDVEMIGATADAIDKAEDRERFRGFHVRQGGTIVNLSLTSEERR